MFEPPQSGNKETERLGCADIVYRFRAVITGTNAFTVGDSYQWNLNLVNFTIYWWYNFLLSCFKFTCMYVLQLYIHCTVPYIYEPVQLLCMVLCDMSHDTVLYSAVLYATCTAYYTVSCTGSLYTTPHLGGLVNGI